jgi:hypothetical protein
VVLLGADIAERRLAIHRAEDVRQEDRYGRTAIELDTFYDAAVERRGPVTDRPGFAEMLERPMFNGARTIVVESPDRFA